MMKKICLIIFSILIFFNSLLCQGEDGIFTVIAPSGLSLRSAPGLDSDRIIVIPFGEQVTIDEMLGDPYISDAHDRIDNRFGYWLPVIYGEEKGYLFSAYLKYGYLLVPEMEINSDFRITVSGIRCDALNFDPDMHWYAFKIKENKDGFDIIPVSPELNVDLEWEEEEEDFMHASIGDFVELKAGIEKGPYLMLGSKTPLDIKSLNKGHLFTSEDLISREGYGKPIYPYQSFRVSRNDGYESYTFSGQENVHIIGKTKRDSYVQRIYQMDFYPFKDGLESKRINLTELLDPAELEYIEGGVNYEIYHHPRLLWSGDINGDDLLDFIFYRGDYSECCGGDEAYYLIQSSVNNGVITYEKAAEDTISTCFGC